MNAVRRYAGIGSRETPATVQETMGKIAKWLADHGFTLTSGHAEGADLAFERSAGTAKEIYLAKDAEEWCYKEVSKYLDPGMDLGRMRQYVRDLIARNMKQILGKEGHQWVEFVVCWTPNAGDVGGTRYAIRCAKAHGIPVYNIADPLQLEAFRKFCKTLVVKKPEGVTEQEREELYKKQPVFEVPEGLLKDHVNAPFVPKSWLCYRCKKDLLSHPKVLEDARAGVMITGCPFCHRSYCD